jgi:mannose-6-phosphate isomerase-like protein (cupin superfamily)
MAEFVAPTGDGFAGTKEYARPHSPYERYMEGEGIPIFRGFGVSDTRELPLGDWTRRNARGSFLFLRGIEDYKGLYLLEVPSGDATVPEKHMYDEFFYVLEGHGSTEVWRGDTGSKQVFEWQPGSLFMIPINASYRLVNATGSPALLISANNAPPIINIFQNHRFVFENDWDFSDRYGMNENFFKPEFELEPDPVRSRASIRSNVYPDIVNCELPLDNQRGPGYRRIQPGYHGFIADELTGGFIGHYPTGRYSKGHYHDSGAVLLCLRGKGYTFNWPVSAGPTPWKDGNEDQVNKIEYVPGGLVAAAPGGGNWFHQHFGISKEDFRVLNFWGGPFGRWGAGSSAPAAKGDMVKAGNLHSISEGGSTIQYWEEDPFVREYFKKRLAEEGAEFTMPPPGRP